jgi:hypothetical protein
LAESISDTFYFFVLGAILALFGVALISNGMIKRQYGSKTNGRYLKTETNTADLNSKKRRNYKILVGIVFLTIFLLLTYPFYFSSQRRFSLYWFADLIGVTVLIIFSYVIGWYVDRKYPKQLAPSGLQKY